MKNHTFNFEIVTLTTQFADAFNDIVIKRYNEQRQSNGQEIGVTFVYSPKQRVIYDLTNKQNNLKLPIVSFNINSFNRDTSRVFNKIQGVEIDGPYRYSKILQPVPIDLGITLNVMTKFQLDMDQILSNFVPYCDPYVVVSWPDPYAGQEIRTIIEWDGNLNITYPMDQTATTPFSRIEANANFTMKGWLFKSNSGTVGKIHNIYANFFNVNDIFCNYTAMQQATSEFAVDQFIYKGKPVIYSAFPVTLLRNVSSQVVYISGSNFSHTKDYYISLKPANIIGTPTIYNFTTSQYVSSYVDYITGFQIYPTIINDNVLKFEVSTKLKAGRMDVIGINPAGIGKLTVDAFREVPCPYPNYAACSGWGAWQPVFVTNSGIKIFGDQGVGFMIIQTDFIVS